MSSSSEARASSRAATPGDPSSRPLLRDRLEQERALERRREFRDRARHAAELTPVHVIGHAIALAGREAAELDATVVARGVESVVDRAALADGVRLRPVEANVVELAGVFAFRE